MSALPRCLTQWRQRDPPATAREMPNEMVEQQMEPDCPLGPLVGRPVEQRSRQIDHGGVQGQQTLTKNGNSGASSPDPGSVDRAAGRRFGTVARAGAGRHRPRWDAWERRAGHDGAACPRRPPAPRRSRAGSALAPIGKTVWLTRTRLEYRSSRGPLRLQCKYRV
jgi:hypothetical protein